MGAELTTEYTVQYIWLGRELITKFLILCLLAEQSLQNEVSKYKSGDVIGFFVVPPMIGVTVSFKYMRQGQYKCTWGPLL